MANKKTDLMRADIEFKKFVKDLSIFKSNQEKTHIFNPRITKAILNQYKKYPNLIEEIKMSKLGGKK